MKVGWVLSGSSDECDVTVNLTSTSTYVLKIEACPPIENHLDNHLKWFWELESLSDG